MLSKRNFWYLSAMVLAIIWAIYWVSSCPVPAAAPAKETAKKYDEVLRRGTDIKYFVLTFEVRELPNEGEATTIATQDLRKVDYLLAQDHNGKICCKQVPESCLNYWQERKEGDFRSLPRHWELWNDVPFPGTDKDMDFMLRMGHAVYAETKRETGRTVYIYQPHFFVGGAL
jgi:hypothetical protein